MEKTDNLYDAVIIGGGPAGLTAALYLARARYRVIVLEKDSFGGQIAITDEVVNYPGVERTSGAALAETMRRQAQSFGAEFLPAEALSLSLSGDIKTVRTSRGELRCFGLLLATGARPRMAGFRGEEELRGRGVAYCATCDGEFFSGRPVFVVGGGYAAAEESVFLTRYASSVTVLMRGADFKCAEATAEAARKNEKIKILPRTIVEEAGGEGALRYLRYRNTETGEQTEYRPPDGGSFGLFVFAGYEPETGLLRGLAELDEQGYVITDRSLRTSVEGVYAAGDLCIKPLRQAVTAAGDGALAATELERHAAQMQRKTGLTPQRPQAQTSQGAKPVENSASFFEGEVLAQLEGLFSKMQGSLVLKLYLDERPVSGELRRYMEELAALTDKLRVVMGEGEEPARPCVRVCDEKGRYCGLAFHGVPGGHEFTSFVLGLYNAAGPGQQLDAEAERALRAIKKPLDLKILVSLSCTLCPELVTAAQRLAAASESVNAEVFDISHFPDMRERYGVMSVPCLVINDGDVSFGRKNIPQLLELIEKQSAS